MTVAVAAAALALTAPTANGDGGGPRGEARSDSAGAAADVPAGVVDGPTARRLVATGVKVVDVRTPAEFRAGHVPGAVNIPFDELAQRAGEVGPGSAPVLLYCQTGRRSAIAAETLRQKGFTRLYDLQSYERWVASAPSSSR
jgi:rhodanese-related sulfurtransferase